MADNSNNVTITGVFGTFVAALLSWLKWHSVGWLIVNGLFGWGYVIYYAIRYGIHF